MEVSKSTTIVEVVEEEEEVVAGVDGEVLVEFFLARATSATRLVTGQRSALKIKTIN